MNIGFYGGRNGQDFSIKEIFPTKVELDKDLGKSWTSPISVGEYVVVSYGLANDPDYELKKTTDLKAYGRSYNSTLWRKKYTEDGSGSANGLSYELIASMTGNTPRLSVVEPITVLDADELPDVDGDNSDPDYFILTFKLPQSQVLTKANPFLEILDADQMPNIIYDDSVDINKPTLAFKLPQSQILGPADTFLEILDANEMPQVIYDDTKDINKPTLAFKLPQSQVIEEVVVTVADSNIPPSIIFDDDTDGTVNHPILKFALPRAQLLQLAETIRVSANVMPSVSLDSSDPSNPVLTFSLPRAQVMASPQTTVIGPDQVPTVTLDSSNIDEPFLKFQLPRAVRFYYGAYLGEREAGTYTISSSDFADYGIGDYYINAATGFIYKVTAKTGNECTFVYQASIQQPLPDTIATPINPYTESDTSPGTYVPADPTVSRQFTNNDGTKWKMEFGLPQAPTPQVEVEWLGPEEAGQGASVAPTSETNITFNFKIPQGAKVFAGLEVYAGTVGQSVDIGASIGDLYLNTDTGVIYKWKGGLWEPQEGSLKGPVGDALNIVRDYVVLEADGIPNTLADVAAYIETMYVDDAGNPITPSPDEIFAVTWRNLDESEETSYWYYKTEEGKWGRVQLTGGISNLIENEYNDESSGEVTDKTYSIHYINSLIGGKIDPGAADRTTFSAEQIYALWSWGTFDDTGIPDWFPEDSLDPTTLSAEEIIALMSWGSIAQLMATT